MLIAESLYVTPHCYPLSSSSDNYSLRKSSISFPTQRHSLHPSLVLCFPHPWRWPTGEDQLPPPRSPRDSPSARSPGRSSSSWPRPSSSSALPGSSATSQPWKRPRSRWGGSCMPPLWCSSSWSSGSPPWRTRRATSCGTAGGGATPGLRPRGPPHGGSPPWSSSSWFWCSTSLPSLRCGLLDSVYISIYIYIYIPIPYVIICFESPDTISPIWFRILFMYIFYYMMPGNSEPVCRFEVSCKCLINTVKWSWSWVVVTWEFYISPIQGFILTILWSFSLRRKQEEILGFIVISWYMSNLICNKVE